METTEIKKDEWCQYCWWYGTKTHMCWGKQLAMNPNRLAIPRWVSAWEHREYWTGLCTLNFIINE